MISRVGATFAHHGVLNVALLETEPVSGLDKGCELLKEIESFGKGEVAPRAIRWLEATQSHETLPPAFYRPLLYITWGSFDLAAVFLSPDLYLPNYMGRPLAVHQLQRGVLVKPVKADIDVTAGFIEALGNGARWPFMAFTKLKINPALHYATGGIKGDRTPVIDRSLDLINSRAQEWQQAWPSGHRAAAIGIGLGWSELLVVGFAHQLECLSELVHTLRDLTTNGDPHEESLFATTVTKLGYQHAIAQDVDKALRKQAKAGLDADGRLRASALVDVARAADQPPVARPRTETMLKLTPGFSVYPGAESRLLARLAAAAAAVPDDLKAHIRFPDRPQFEMGNRDVLGPTVTPNDVLGDVGAVAYLDALQRWLLADGMLASSPLGESLYFTTRTGVQFVAAGSEVDVRLGKIRPDWLEDLDGHLDQLKTRVRNSLQRLQVQYARTEQLLNLVGTLQWAHRRSVVWEEVIALTPVLLCVVSYMEDVCSRWEELRNEVLRPRRGDVAGHEELSTFTEAEKMHQDIKRIIREFRSSFYNRHLSGYLTDDTPDINLRYRGSIQQLLNISNLVLDAMVEVVLGERACLTTIGDITAPQVYGPCDVIVANLHAETLRYPMLLEILGHEVGHQFAIELLREASGDYRRHRWTSGARDASTFRATVSAFGDVWKHVYIKNLDVNDAFMEVVADLIERHLLGGDIESWVRSHMLRSLLVAEATGFPDSESGEAGEVPVVDPRTIKSSMIRMCHAVIMERLAEAHGDWGFKEFAGFAKSVKAEELEQLRVVLSECLLGPSGELHGVVTDPALWDAFLKYDVFSAPWLRGYEFATYAARCSRSLRQHVQERQQGVRMWQLVREEMMALRTVVLSNLSSALHVRHWINWKDVGDVQLSDLRDSYIASRRTLPWLVVGTPAMNAGPSGELARAKAVVLQRGRVTLTEPAGMESMTNAHAKFIYELLMLAPAWRKGVADKACRLESRVGPKLVS